MFSNTSNSILLSKSTKTEPIYTISSKQRRIYRKTQFEDYNNNKLITAIDTMLNRSNIVIILVEQKDSACY